MKEKEEEVVKSNREVSEDSLEEGVRSGGVFNLSSKANDDDGKTLDIRARERQEEAIVTAVIGEFREVREGKIVESGASKQDDCQDYGLVSAKEDDIRSHSVGNDDRDLDDIDEDKKSIIASNNSHEDSDNQVDDENFVIREQVGDYNGLQNRPDKKEGESYRCDETKKSGDVVGKFCFNDNKTMEAAMSSLPRSFVSETKLREDFDEILDDKPETLRREARVGEVKVCGQVTAKTRPYSSRTPSISTTSSSSSSLCSKLDKLKSQSSSKSGAIENIQKHLDSSSSMQITKHKLEDQSGTSVPSRMEKLQVAAASSGCSLCDYLNLAHEFSKHHEQCSKLESSKNLDKSSIANNDIEQRDQLGAAREEEIQAQPRKLQFSQHHHQVELCKKGQLEVPSSSSIKPQNLAAFSIWNNLEANLSADVYKYELEANLMLRRPTRCCYGNSYCSVKDNYRNNESGIVDISGCCSSINGKVERSHELHALNNQASQLLHNDQKEGRKIGQVLCYENDDDRVVSKGSVGSNLEGLVDSTNESTDEAPSISQKKTTMTNTTRRLPALKSLRGLSLDSNNRQPQNSTQTFRKRLSSRRLLINQGKSLSTKLIIIKGNDASYTIQGK